MAEEEAEKIEEQTQNHEENNQQTNETNGNYKTNVTTQEEEKNQGSEDKIKGKRKFDKTIKTEEDDIGNFERTNFNDEECKNNRREHIKTQADEYHEKFKEYGIKSLHVLDKNITNPRYPGFSEFFSSNSLQNSSYCWTISKDKRIKDKAYKKLNDNIYNLPNFKSTRFTIQGFGLRKDFRPVYGKDDPSPDAYKIKSLFDINLQKRKGPTILGKSCDSRKEGKYMPGPGAYNMVSRNSFGQIPIVLKSRQGFFYDDDLKKKKATVSMQKYKPLHNLVEKNRFHAITFGIGDRPKLNPDNKYPGPGAYHVPGCFDRGFKGKLPLN